VASRIPRLMDVDRGRKNPNLQSDIIIVRGIRPSSRITYTIKTGRLNVCTAFTARRPPSTSSTAAEVSEIDLNANPKGEAHKSESTHATYYNKRPQEYDILLLLLLLL